MTEEYDHQGGKVDLFENAGLFSWYIPLPQPIMQSILLGKPNLIKEIKDRITYSPFPFP